MTDELAIPRETLLEQGNDIDGLLCLLSDKVGAIHHSIIQSSIWLKW